MRSFYAIYKLIWYVKFWDVSFIDYFSLSVWMDQKWKEWMRGFSDAPRWICSTLLYLNVLLIRVSSKFKKYIFQQKDRKQLLYRLLLKTVNSRGVVVITTAQLHSTKPELRFCAGSNRARGVSEIRDGEDLTIVPAGNKAKRLSPVNHTTLTIHHHHQRYIILPHLESSNFHYSTFW